MKKEHVRCAGFLWVGSTVVTLLFVQHVTSIPVGAVFHVGDIISAMVALIEASASLMRTANTVASPAVAGGDHYLRGRPLTQNFCSESFLSSRRVCSNASHVGRLARIIE